MKALALALALVVALPCYAQDVAPVTDVPAAVVKAGEFVPFDGLLLSDSAAIDAAKRLAVSEAKASSLEASVKASPAWWVPVIIGVVALGAGVGLGYAVSSASAAK